MSKRVLKFTEHSLIQSFVYAFNGIKDAIKREPNLRIHLLLGTIACVLALFLNFALIEWAVLSLTIAIVFILELINTTMETLVDIVSPEIKEKARIAKDVAAAGVLLAAMASLIIGAFLFLPKILVLLQK